MSYLPNRINKDDWLKRVYQKSNSLGSVQVAKLAIANLEYFTYSEWKSYLKEFIIAHYNKQKHKKTLLKELEHMLNDWKKSITLADDSLLQRYECSRKDSRVIGV